MDTASRSRTLRLIRIWLTVFIIGLVISGVTAFPLYTELTLAHTFLQQHREVVSLLPFGADLTDWIHKVAEGVRATHDRYPFIAYGTDWLAFAHLVIAIAFIGPFKDPQRNVWVIWWGMIACMGIIPLALLAGPVRGIPFGWSLIDISFGVFGIIPLLIVLRLIKRLDSVAPSA